MFHETFVEEQDNDSKLCLELLSPRSRDEIQINYTRETQLPIPDISKPPAPIDAFNNALGYLNRVKNQRFLDNFHSEEFERLYYNTQNSALKQISSKTIPKSDDNDEIKQDQEIAFWLNTDSFKGYERELRRLPYKEQLYLVKAVSKLGDCALQLAQQIKHEKSTKRRFTINDEKKTMKFFVEHIQEAANAIIKQDLEEDRFDNSKLPDNLKKLYRIKPEKKIEVVKEPIEIKKKDTDLEKIVTENLNTATKDLPAMYKINPHYGFSQDSLDKILGDTNKNVSELFKFAIENQKLILPPPEVKEIKEEKEEIVQKHANTTRVIVNPNRKRQIVEIKKEIPQTKSLTKEQMINNYWDQNDPLETRTSRQKILDDLKFIGNDLNFNHVSAKFSRREICFPFKPEEIDEISDSLGKQIPLAAQITGTGEWNDSELLLTQIQQDAVNKSQQIERESYSMHDFQEEEENNPPTVKILPKPIESNNEDVMKILKSYKPGTSSIDIRSENIFLRLSKIWNELGFSIKDRLGLSAKYSQSTEETSKLSDAMGAWEICFEKAKYYNKYYRDIKDYLAFDAFKYNKYSPVLVNLEQEYSKSEYLLIDAGNRLKDVYQDKLIVNGRDYIDLINLRRLKLKKKLELSDLPIPDFLLEDAMNLLK
ncbi:hypothetical protein TVAG_088740 [Trichomonas vaginalis G3]|uniref:Uncharacterized protein n=1 Tax=Trichomonas vaginalis (strain ATCC PRA-98 / G3) TaxID=412133 RepID=A2EB19_TRIV3|nr:coiled-coil domain-containing protein 87 family [Trichomonas vaginalis G3]EAY10159.1 hypothetical protein TVAG_088740 [Trichomonas vaginalis G3]KAI5534466.1 coiled-coil domain-containing protein 87 family [Trichomonas vaginalis G3]|eukprot:XP_001322382.1 hypothetical protein [Trichomonas vaginalis G3]